MIASQTYPPGTKFLDVEGIPVRIGPANHCHAHDGPSPRPFNLTEAQARGQMVSEATFRVIELQHLYRRVAA